MYFSKPYSAPLLLWFWKIWRISGFKKFGQYITLQIIIAKNQQKILLKRFLFKVLPSDRIIQRKCGSSQIWFSEWCLQWNECRYAGNRLACWAHWQFWWNAWPFLCHTPLSKVVTVVKTWDFWFEFWFAFFSTLWLDLYTIFDRISLWHPNFIDFSQFLCLKQSKIR